MLPHYPNDKNSHVRAKLQQAVGNSTHIAHGGNAQEYLPARVCIHRKPEAGVGV